MALLQARGVTKAFGGLTAVDTVDLTVLPGRIVSIIGPNGAGKTTLFNCLTGIYRPSEGEVWFEGKLIGQPPAEVGYRFGLAVFLAILCLVAGAIGGADIAAKCLPVILLYLGFDFAQALGRGDRKGPLSAPEHHEERGLLIARAGTLGFFAGLALLSWHATGRVAPAVAGLVPWLGGLLAAGGLAAVVGGVVARGLAVIPPHRATALGMARTFQNIRLFPEMTAIENVMVGMHCRTASNSWRVFGAAFGGLALGGTLAWAGAERLGAAWWPAWAVFGATALGLALRFHLAARRRDRGLAGRALELLRFVGIERHAESWARNLPYGDQRRLEIARALATEPKLLLLDEPAAGMNPQESQTLMDLIRRIRDTGVTVLLIEHHMKVVMGISDWVVVLDSGKKLTEGEPAKIQNDPQVIEAYLGREEDLD